MLSCFKQTFIKKIKIKRCFKTLHESQMSLNYHYSIAVDVPQSAKNADSLRGAGAGHLPRENPRNLAHPVLGHRQRPYGGDPERQQERPHEQSVLVDPVLHHAADLNAREPLIVEGAQAVAHAAHPRQIGDDRGQNPEAVANVFHLLALRKRDHVGEEERGRGFEHVVQARQREDFEMRAALQAEVVLVHSLLTVVQTQNL